MPRVKVQDPKRIIINADRAFQQHSWSVRLLEKQKSENWPFFKAKDLTNARSRLRYSIDRLSQGIALMFGVKDGIISCPLIKMREGSRGIGRTRNQKPVKVVDHTSPDYPESILGRKLCEYEKAIYNKYKDEDKDEKDYILGKFKEDDEQKKLNDKAEAEAEDEYGLCDANGKVVLQTTDEDFTQEKFDEMLYEDVKKGEGDLAYNDKYLTDEEKFTGPGFMVPLDTEERTLLEWWDYEFGNSKIEMPVGILAERLEVHPPLAYKVNIDYFLPRDFVTKNPVTTFAKWKANLPTLEQLARKVTLHHRAGLIDIPVTDDEAVQAAIKELSNVKISNTDDDYICSHVESQTLANVKLTLNDIFTSISEGNGIPKFDGIDNEVNMNHPHHKITYKVTFDVEVENNTKPVPEIIIPKVLTTKRVKPVCVTKQNEIIEEIEEVEKPATKSCHDVNQYNKARQQEVKLDDESREGSANEDSDSEVLVSKVSDSEASDSEENDEGEMGPYSSRYDAEVQYDKALLDGKNGNVLTIDQFVKGGDALEEIAMALSEMPLPEKRTPTTSHTTVRLAPGYPVNAPNTTSHVTVRLAPGSPMNAPNTTGDKHVLNLAPIIYEETLSFATATNEQLKYMVDNYDEIERQKKLQYAAIYASLKTGAKETAPTKSEQDNKDEYDSECENENDNECDDDSDDDDDDSDSDSEDESDDEDEGENNDDMPPSVFEALGLDMLGCSNSSECDKDESEEDESEQDESEEDDTEMSPSIYEALRPDMVGCSLPPECDKDKDNKLESEAVNELKTETTPAVTDEVLNLDKTNATIDKELLSKLLSNSEKLVIDPKMKGSNLDDIIDNIVEAVTTQQRAQNTKKLVDRNRVLEDAIKQNAKVQEMMMENMRRMTEILSRTTTVPDMECMKELIANQNRILQLASQINDSIDEE